MRVIEPLLKDCARVLEIGSGTGQHAVYFAARMKHLTWIASDLPSNHPGIVAWLRAADRRNIRGPLALDVHAPEWPVGAADAVFSANTAHIMDITAVEAMFKGTGRILPGGGPFLLYGPFCRGGRQTSDSNLRFDHFLRTKDPSMGIRDLDCLEVLAAEAGLRLEQALTMPANNMTLVWRKRVSPTLTQDALPR